jgi:hypothetical protein
MTSINIHAKIYLFLKHTYKKKEKKRNGKEKREKIFNVDCFFRYLYYLHVHFSYVFLNQNFDKNLLNISYMYMVLFLNVYTYEILNYIFDEKPKRNIKRNFKATKISILYFTFEQIEHLYCFIVE